MESTEWELTVTKSFRCPESLVEDAEKVLQLAVDSDGKPKYRFMTGFVVSAIRELVKKERRGLEAKGVAWDHLGPDIKQSLSKE